MDPAALFVIYNWVKDGLDVYDYESAKASDIWAVGPRHVELLSKYIFK